MPEFRRVTIDDVLPHASHPDAHAARRLDALRRVAMATDHIVNRAKSDTERWGEPSPIDHPENASDFAEAERQVNVLKLAAEAGRKMIDGVKAQLTPAPAKPKPATLADAPKK